MGNFDPSLNSLKTWQTLQQSAKERNYCINKTSDTDNNITVLLALISS